MLSLTTLLIAIPAVILSAEHEAMCRVAVGDPFPAIEGKADDGQKVLLEAKQGSKATVVATPGGAVWMDQMLAKDLRDDFSPKYTEKGVSFVTLDTAAPGEGVTALQVGRAKVAEVLGPGRGPRVYLLDSAGKIVWFDIEYTLSTHRELHQALDELTAD